MKKHPKLRLRAATIRLLSTLEIDGVKAGYLASGDDCKSVNPCPGEYTWFCAP